MAKFLKAYPVPKAMLLKFQYNLCHIAKPFAGFLSRVMDKKKSEKSLKPNKLAGIKEIFKIGQ
jgi:hypothetical protein